LRLVVHCGEAEVRYQAFLGRDGQPEQVPASGLSWSEICHLNDSH